MEVPRPLPLLVKNYRRPRKIDWNNLNNTIRACAKEVEKAGYMYFGLQFYGECWSGPQAHLTYDEDGESKGCIDGVGMQRANFVYRLVFKGDNLLPRLVMDNSIRCCFAGYTYMYYYVLGNDSQILQ